MKTDLGLCSSGHVKKYCRPQQVRRQPPCAAACQARAVEITKALASRACTHTPISMPLSSGNCFKSPVFLLSSSHQHNVQIEPLPGRLLLGWQEAP